MDEERARRLLDAEREATQRRLRELLGAARDDRAGANEPGDMFDSAQPLVQEETDDAVVAQLQRHLEAIERARHRLDSGTFGLSVRSGRPIPDERLESDPTAELTVEEARAERS